MWPARAPRILPHDGQDLFVEIVVQAAATHTDRQRESRCGSGTRHEQRPLAIDVRAAESHGQPA